MFKIYINFNSCEVQTVNDLSHNFTGITKNINFMKAYLSFSSNIPQMKGKNYDCVIPEEIMEEMEKTGHEFTMLNSDKYTNIMYNIEQFKKKINGYIRYYYDIEKSH